MKGALAAMNSVPQVSDYPIDWLDVLRKAIIVECFEALQLVMACGLEVPR